MELAAGGTTARKSGEEACLGHLLGRGSVEESADGIPGAAVV
jgi:hypothetical protein